ncbi:erythromycin esterase family protein [Aquimarina sp. RZ0]|uniref:erythromycin esterase family protein n=1 Tax=Aquimarina sp. RZ0 TaxID=2607730 RepID=UPI00165FB5A6|nr:erythromycin esterase family protein [Aquimarina sp. RZ0]
MIAQETLFQFKVGKETPVQGSKRHVYQVKLNKGELLQLELLQKNVDLQIIAFSSSNDTLQLFDSPNGVNGIEIVEFVSEQNQTYHFEVIPFIPESFTDSIRQKHVKKINGSYLVSKYEILSSIEHTQLQHARKVRKDSVINWIKNKSITLKSVKAKKGFEDLMYLKPILKDIQVVGLGETSHGTKEVFQMKHRMLEFLVKEMGFTIFAIEASNVGCRSINDYVLHGKGNSREALTEQGFWIWNTEEVIDMIEWMRTYNKTVPDNKKIKFFGIDTQMVALDLAYKNVGNFIKKTGKSELLTVEVDSLFRELSAIADRSDLSLQRQQLYTLLFYLVVNEFKLVNKTSRAAYIGIIKDVRKIIQGVEDGDRKFGKSISFNPRDEYMAQTVLEILQNEKPDAKMALWAHNCHISKNAETEITGKIRPLGSILKEYIGKRYYAVGFSTNQGSFRAMNRNVNKGKNDKNTIFKLPPAKQGNLDWYFAQVYKEIFFIDFVKSLHPKTIATFLSQERKAYSCGASWSLDYGILPAFDISPSKSFDGMIFIKETSSAVLTPAGEKEIEKRIQNGK